MARAFIVTAGEVAARLGWRHPTIAQRQALDGALEDAHDDVEAYLGQPITPTQVSESGLFPVGDTWILTHDPIEVVSVVPEHLVDGGGLSGLFTVTYTYGLDAATDPQLRPIRRYIVAAVMAHPTVVTLWQETLGEGARRVRSLGAEGQSVTYDYLTPDGATTTTTTAGAGQVAGAPPTLASLDRWRVAGRRVYQRPGNYYDDEVYRRRDDGTGYRNGWWSM